MSGGFDHSPGVASGTDTAALARMHAYPTVSGRVNFVEVIHEGVPRACGGEWQGAPNSLPGSAGTAEGQGWMLPIQAAFDSGGRDDGT